MSQENVEIVRRWFDGLNVREVSPELCDPEIEIRNWSGSLNPAPIAVTTASDAGGRRPTIRTWVWTCVSSKSRRSSMSVTNGCGRAAHDGARSIHRARARPDVGRGGHGQAWEDRF